MDRIRSTAIAVIGLVVAVFGLAAALGGSVAPGVLVGPDGADVVSVDPGSFAWRDGIRPGQVVVALSAADEAEGWAIETRDGDAVIRSAAGPQGRLLQATQPVAVLAVVLAGTAVVQLPRRRRSAEAMASLAVVVASLPLAIEGQLGVSSVASGLAFLLPMAAVIRWATIPRPARAALVILAVVLSAAWITLRLLGQPAYVPLEQLRLVAVAGATLAMLGTVVGWRRPDLSMLTRPRLIDALTLDLAGLAGVVAVLLLARIPLLAVALLVALVLVVYPTFRHRTLTMLDRAFLAEQRERATIATAEAQRARLARELHDSPLQELAGAIKRLELVPEAHAEEAVLRQVADELRRLTGELHPPVLDDLGLVAAIQHLVDQARATTAVALVVEITDHAGLPRADRPPEEVELNLFRIVQEAVGNALKHSDASAIRVSGEVSARRVQVLVEDDGSGLRQAAADAALRAGRMGLPSMRRRAEAIGAELEVGASAAKGTRVAIDWETRA